MTARAALLGELARRVQPLCPHVNHYAWGGDVLPRFLNLRLDSAPRPTAEAWLTSTQEDGRVGLKLAPLTLADLIAECPEVLGSWSRKIWGDDLPIFTKFLSTRFPPKVHMGFDPRALDDYDQATFGATFLGWLEREQELLRRLYEAVDTDSLTTEGAFAEFRAVYEAWAVDQSVNGWQDAARDGAFVEGLAAFLRPGHQQDGELSALVRDLRENRARIVTVLNEVDLRAEEGNLLLSHAGMAHAIFGLSHQGHAQDRARARVQELYRALREAAAGGATVGGLDQLVEEAAPDLERLRASNKDAPKNEAWLPFTVDGEVVIAEPQQTSNTTYSWLDMYTPFVFEDGRMVFRKGDARGGVSREALAEFVDEIDFHPEPVDAFRRRPEELAAGPGSTRATLYRLIDDPSAWPYFTAYRIDLDGSPQQPAAWEGDVPAGAFQQVVVVEGEFRLTDADDNFHTLDPARPAFVPATLEGGYTLTSSCRSSALLVSVPTPWEFRRG